MALEAQYHVKVPKHSTESGADVSVLIGGFFSQYGDVKSIEKAPNNEGFVVTIVRTDAPGPGILGAAKYKRADIGGKKMEVHLLQPSGLDFDLRVIRKQVVVTLGTDLVTQLLKRKTVLCELTELGCALTLTQSYLVIGRPESDSPITDLEWRFSVTSKLVQVLGPFSDKLSKQPKSSSLTKLYFSGDRAMAADRPLPYICGDNDHLFLTMYFPCSTRTMFDVCNYASFQIYLSATFRGVALNFDSSLQMVSISGTCRQVEHARSTIISQAWTIQKRTVNVSTGIVHALQIRDIREWVEKQLAEEGRFCRIDLSQDDLNGNTALQLISVESEQGRIRNTIESLLAKDAVPVTKSKAGLVLGDDWESFLMEQLPMPELPYPCVRAVGNEICIAGPAVLVPQTRRLVIKFLQNTKAVACREDSTPTTRIDSKKLGTGATTKPDFPEVVAEEEGRTTSLDSRKEEEATTKIDFRNKEGETTSSDSRKVAGDQITKLGYRKEEEASRIRKDSRKVEVASRRKNSRKKEEGETTKPNFMKEDKTTKPGSMQEEEAARRKEEEEEEEEGETTRPNSIKEDKTMKPESRKEEARRRDSRTEEEEGGALISTGSRKDEKEAGEDEEPTMMSDSRKEEEVVKEKEERNNKSDQQNGMCASELYIQLQVQPEVGLEDPLKPNRQHTPNTNATRFKSSAFLFNTNGPNAEYACCLTERIASGASGRHTFSQTDQSPEQEDGMYNQTLTENVDSSSTEAKKTNNEICFEEKSIQTERDVRSVDVESQTQSIQMKIKASQMKYSTKESQAIQTERLSVTHTHMQKVEDKRERKCASIQTRTISVTDTQMQTTEDKRDMKCEAIQTEIEDKRETKCVAIQTKIEDKRETKCEAIQTEIDQRETKCEAIQREIDQRETKCEAIQTEIDQRETKCEAIQTETVSNTNRQTQTVAENSGSACFTVQTAQDYSETNVKTVMPVSEHAGTQTTDTLRPCSSDDQTQTSNDTARCVQCGGQTQTLQDTARPVHVSQTQSQIVQNEELTRVHRPEQQSDCGAGLGLHCPLGLLCPHENSGSPPNASSVLNNGAAESVVCQSGTGEEDAMNSYQTEERRLLRGQLSLLSCQHLQEILSHLCPGMNSTSHTQHRVDGRAAHETLLERCLAAGDASRVLEALVHLLAKTADASSTNNTTKIANDTTTARSEQTSSVAASECTETPTRGEHQDHRFQEYWHAHLTGPLSSDQDRSTSTAITDDEDSQAEGQAPSTLRLPTHPDAHFPQERFQDNNKRTMSQESLSLQHLYGAGAVTPTTSGNLRTLSSENLSTLSSETQRLESQLPSPYGPSTKYRRATKKPRRRTIPDREVQTLRNSSTLNSHTNECLCSRCVGRRADERHTLSGAELFGRSASVEHLHNAAFAIPNDLRLNEITLHHLLSLSQRMSSLEVESFSRQSGERRRRAENTRDDRSTRTNDPLASLSAQVQMLNASMHQLQQQMQELLLGRHGREYPPANERLRPHPPANGPPHLPADASDSEYCSIANESEPPSMSYGEN